MIAWTVDVARVSGVIDRLIVSTDDDEIASVAREAGAEVPFLRPTHLATDTAASLDVVFHALEVLGEPDIVVLLQPTSPLRAAQDIVDCVAAIRAGAPAAVTVARLDKTWPVFRHRDPNGVLTMLPEPQPAPSHVLTGSVYAVRMSELRSHLSFSPPGTVGVVVPAERSVDVDIEAEFRLCEGLLQTR